MEKRNRRRIVFERGRYYHNRRCHRKGDLQKQSTPNVSGHAISVEKHDLIISGEGTTVEATNQSGAPQNFSNDATVMVEGGSLVVSDGAWLKATNEFTNTSKLYPPDFKNFSYYSSAISGDKNAPCTVSVTGENLVLPHRRIIQRSMLIHQWVKPIGGLILRSMAQRSKSVIALTALLMVSKGINM